MTRLLLLLVLLPVSHAAHVRSGVAAVHSKLERVARIRGMSPQGILFASPIDPLGARVCVSSALHPRSLCGQIVDVAAPEDRAWQLRTGRIIEVQPAVARLLCRDPLGLPSGCPVTTRRE